MSSQTPPPPSNEAIRIPEDGGGAGDDRVAGASGELPIPGSDDERIAEGISEDSVRECESTPDAIGSGDALAAEFAAEVVVPEGGGSGSDAGAGIEAGGGEPFGGNWSGGPSAGVGGFAAEESAGPGGAAWSVDLPGIPGSGEAIEIEIDVSAADGGNGNGGAVGFAIDAGSGDAAGLEVSVSPSGSGSSDATEGAGAGAERGEEGGGLLSRVFRDWGIPILGHYAAIMTALAIYFYVQWQRERAPRPIEEVLAEEARGGGSGFGFSNDRRGSDAGSKTAAPGSGAASAGYRTAVPPALAEGMRIGLGGTLRAGGIEATATRIERVPEVRLVQKGLFNEGGPETEGGSDALRLTLRVTNASTDEAFAPLEKAFAREREGELPDSFIEAGRNRIYVYPLTEFANRDVSGQEFPTLRPGESAEVWILSAPEAFDRLAETGNLWRVKLRTGLEGTETIGIAFDRKDVSER